MPRAFLQEESNSESSDEEDMDEDDVLESSTEGALSPRSGSLSLPSGVLELPGDGQSVPGRQRPTGVSSTPVMEQLLDPLTHIPIMDKNERRSTSSKFLRIFLWLKRAQPPKNLKPFLLNILGHKWQVLFKLFACTFGFFHLFDIFVFSGKT